jgi:hypothetical protein
VSGSFSGEIVLKKVMQERHQQQPMPKPPVKRLRQLARMGIPVLVGAAVTSAAFFVLGAVDADDPAGPVAQPELPRSHYDLLAMSPDKLGKVDVAMMNLICAKGLPGAENLDISVILAQLDTWAGKVRVETERHLYRATDPRYAEHYNHSEARLRAELIVQVLQEDCGVRYNGDRMFDVDFSNAADLFIHGMTSNKGSGGTCASMPVLYVAIGRRLGYPMRLVLAKQHVFCRWDDGQERFNIEGAGNGGVSYLPNEHYRNWPKPISDAEMKTGEFLESLTPREELATFLLSRGTCLHANGQLPEARACFAEAHRLMPNAMTPMLAMRSVLEGFFLGGLAQQRRARGNVLMLP